MASRLVGDRIANFFNFGPGDLPQDHRDLCVANAHYRSLHQTYIDTLRVSEMVEATPTRGSVHEAAVQAARDACENLHDDLVVAAKIILLGGSSGDAIRSERNWCQRCDGWEQRRPRVESAERQGNSVDGDENLSDAETVVE